MERLSLVDSHDMQSVRRSRSSSFDISEVDRMAGDGVLQEGRMNVDADRICRSVGNIEILVLLGRATTSRETGYSIHTF